MLYSTNTLNPNGSRPAVLDLYLSPETYELARASRLQKTSLHGITVRERIIFCLFLRIVFLGMLDPTLPF